MAVKPFSPDQAKEAKIHTIPDPVIEAVNELLAENYGTYINLKQDKVIKRILSKMPNVTKHHLFDNNWLDFEPVYRKEGWEVEYDKSGHNESYEATWTFKRN